jgi:peptidoglycan/LPS O-acetylase OafA/YrhL
MAEERRIVQLDGLRAIAVLMVFFSHAHRSQLLWSGVDLFFVLSGFLITGILLEQRSQTKLGGYLTSFYQRRARRILPPYLLFLGVVALLFGAGWVHHWYLFLFFMNTAPFIQLAHHYYPLSILWSLAVEEQFYLVWPFAIFLLDETALTWLAGSLVLAAPVLRWIATAFFQNHWTVYFAMPFRMDLLAAGALLGIAWRNHRTVVESLGRYGLPIAALAATPLLLLSRYPWFQPAAETVLVNVWLYELILILYVGILLWALSGRGVGLLTLRPMVYLGRISYTFYLVHLAAITILRKHLPHHAGFVALAVSLAYAALSWHWIEQPILKGMWPLRNRKTQIEALAVNQATD